MPSLMPSSKKLILLVTSLATIAPLLLVAPPAEAARFAVIKVFEPRAIKLQPPTERLEPVRPPVRGMPGGALIGGEPRPEGERYRPMGGAILGGMIGGAYRRPHRPVVLPQPERRSWFELHTPK